MPSNSNDINETLVSAVLMTLYKTDNLDFFDIALNSIEKQNGFDGRIRIYLCCDGPLPSSHELWLERNRSRFFYIERNKINLGLAASLNSLIDALGDEEFVFRMDGDDISHPDRFAKQINFMQKNSGIGLIGCFAWDINELGVKTGTRDYPTVPRDCTKALGVINPILHPTFCIRREILRVPSLRYPRAYLTEDLAFLVVLMEYGVIVSNIPERLFYWRLGKEFFSRRTSLKRAFTELKWYSRAVYAGYGLLSYRYIYPIMRFILRMVPTCVQKVVYSSGIRSMTFTSRKNRR